MKAKQMINMIEEQAKMIESMQRNIDDIIISFCEKLGYKVKNVDDLLEVQEDLEERGLRIRLETFYKYKAEYKNIFECEQVTIPFLDDINNPITRREIRKICGLADYF